jgi:elongation factor G
MRFEPMADLGFEFLDQVRGGNVPTEFIPSVRRGVEEAMAKGVLAAYPVVGVRAVLLDGTAHSVDSSDMAFKVAGSMAFKQAFRQSGPRILEPIMKLEIATPDDHIGDIVGDLGSRRARVLAMRRFRKGSQKINAVAPLGEMFGYATVLRTLTSGRAAFSMEFQCYEPAPTSIQERIVAERQAAK